MDEALEFDEWSTVRGLLYRIPLHEALSLMLDDGIFRNPATGLCTYCEGSVSTNEHCGPCPVAAVTEYVDKIPDLERDRILDRHADVLLEFMRLASRLRN